MILDGSMKLDKAYLEKLKRCTIDTLSKIRTLTPRVELGLPNVDVEIVEQTEDTPKDLWYGYADYDRMKVCVLCPNIAHEVIGYSKQSLSDVDMDKKTVAELDNVFKSISKKKLFYIINQSGMDHELGGHFYDFYCCRHPGEISACERQIEMAKYRAEKDKDWNIISEIMPKVLGHHKGISL